jgi:hypothetical protein
MVSSVRVEGRVNAKMDKPRNPRNKNPSRYSVPSSIPPNLTDGLFFPFLPWDGLVNILVIRTPPNKTMVNDMLMGARSHCIALATFGA